MDLRVIEFKTEYPAGKEPVDWVHFTARTARTDTGVNTHSTWEKISRVTPTESRSNDDEGLKMKAMRWQWAQIEPAYRAWKDGQIVPESGTPLAAWSGVTPDQAQALKSVGIHTVEAMANATEIMLSAPPMPGMRDLKRQALAWLEGMPAAQQAATIARLEEQHAAMVEMLAEMQKEEPAKRGPGRPKKEEAVE
jgi:hypothetical protein